MNAVYRSIGVTAYRCAKLHTDTPTRRHSDTNSTSLRHRAGFSLTEILIVIGLIVLMVALAVPTFNFISGNRSVEGASNSVSALLSRARAEAIGLQETRGVFFFIDRVSGNINMALVREVEAPTTTFTPPAGQVDPTEPRPEVWLDLVPDAEFVALPGGVMLHTIDDAMVNNAGRRVEDAYIGYNRRNDGNNSGAGNNNPTHTLYGGVILFDGSGQMVARRYAFKTFSVSPLGGSREPTRMGDLLYEPRGDPNPLVNHHQTINDAVPIGRPPTSMGGFSHYYPKSQIGVALFDREAWRTAFPPLANPPYEPEYDWQFEPQGTEYLGVQTREDLEEQWIDDNALPLLVNRYNGTLVKGE